MLCEFKYGRVTDTSFYADQKVPRKLFYQMKKELFPRAYMNIMPKGKWYGAGGPGPITPKLTYQ